jgi:esterase/lipase
MSANPITNSRFTYGANTQARSSVIMQASIALTGDGPFEEVENYMDQMDEMKDKAMSSIKGKMEEISETYKNEMSQTSDAQSGQIM